MTLSIETAAGRPSSPVAADGVRTLGVEEEFLLLDPETGQVTADAEQVVRTAAAAGPAVDPTQPPPPAGAIGHELTQGQVETATAVVRDLAQLRQQLERLRRTVADAAGANGAVAAATATSLLPVRTVLTPNPRYQRMADEFGITARQELTCGCHVHVAVADDEEGVAVLDRIRPWLATLAAIAANSPFWNGLDTRYSGYRTQLWGRWPTSGPTGGFGSAAAYRECVEQLLASRTILDEGMLYFDARLSRRYPTVEIRVADVALDVDTAVLVAALARALVATAARQWRDGVPAPEVRTELLRLAAWRSSRSGLDGELVDVQGVAGGAGGADRNGQVPARQRLEQLQGYVHEELERAGDVAEVRELCDGVLGRGTGAARQRAVFQRRGELTDLVPLVDIGGPGRIPG